MEFLVRDATEADLEAVAEIKVRSWAETYTSLLPPAVLRPYLDRSNQLAALGQAVAQPDTVLLIAQDRSSKVVGFSLLFLAHRPEPLLESLHVLGEVQGQGVGTLLIRATAARIKATGHSSMRLMVIAGNTGAERFYERLGATTAGREPASWAQGVWHNVFRWPDVGVLLEQQTA
jgi:ribosomal protein S18 acetylase RimI-like enzyme